MTFFFSTQIALSKDIYVIEQSEKKKTDIVGKPFSDI